VTREEERRGPNVPFPQKPFLQEGGKAVGLYSVPSEEKRRAAETRWVEFRGVQGGRRKSGETMGELWGELNVEGEREESRRGARRGT